MPIDPWGFPMPLDPPPSLLGPRFDALSERINEALREAAVACSAADQLLAIVRRALMDLVAQPGEPERAQIELSRVGIDPAPVQALAADIRRILRSEGKISE